MYGLRLRTKRKGNALIFGSAWHILSSVWWKTKTEGGNAQARWHACRLAADEIFQDLEQKTEGFDPHNPVKVNLEDLKAMRSMMAGMLRGYEGRYGLDDTLTMLADELVVGHHTLSVKGNAGASMVMGRIDKLIVDNYGQHWIMEHKTTKSSLADWRFKNGYDPQAATYAWLAKHELGIEVVGVVYDLVLKAVSPEPKRFKVVASGDRLSKTLPAHCTATALRNAIGYHGFREEDQAWYQSRLIELDNKADPFFRREFVRFTAGAVERVGLELHAEAKRLRAYQRMIDKAEMEYNRTHRSTDWRNKVTNILSKVGHEYPRNASACVNQYGRQCSFMDLCRHQSVESMAGLEMLPFKHRELVDDTQCTCAASDTLFRDPKYVSKFNDQHAGIIDLCIVCGLERKPLLQPNTALNHTAA